MKYPHYKIYEKLYQKYLNRENLCNMMDLAGGDYTDKNFLDLCCGNGDATEEAMDRNAKFCLMIDQEVDMIPDERRWGVKTRLRLYQDVSKALRYLDDYLPNKKFDIVFCRQAINYWLTPADVKNLTKRMSKNGIFIFNTFNTKPTNKPMVKEYTIDDVCFTEISYLVENDIIHHVQIREGFPPHLTQFKWMSKKYFKDCLDKYFEIEIIEKNKTDIYKCIKRQNVV